MINTFLPMRNKFVYSYSMKIRASGFDELLESISPAKSCRDAWRSGILLLRVQGSMVDEAKLCSPIHSTFEALVVRHEVGCCCGEELSLFCWPMLAVGTAVFGASHLFAELNARCNGFTRIQKAVVDQTGSRPSNSDHDLVLVQVWLWEVLWTLGRSVWSFEKYFGASSQSSHWAGPCLLSYKIHLSLRVTVWWEVVHCCRIE